MKEKNGKSGNVENTVAIQAQEKTAEILGV